MRFAVLGALEVTDDGGTVVAIPGAKQRALLTALLIDPGRMVPAVRLIDAVWPDDEPANPANALQVKVSQLRRLLGAGRPAGRSGLLVSHPPGYLLAVGEEQVDAARFERDAAAGRAHLEAGDAHAAVARLIPALGLWRGPAFVEFADAPFAREAARRLDALRISAHEDRIEAELALGRHDHLVAELEALVAAHPLRERPRGQLMLALYRCGRQAEALEVFQATRELLADELGVDPGPELRRRHEAILRQADDVATPPVRPSTGTTPAARPTGSLPVPLTSFIGRSEEVDRLVGMVAATPLVTLTGPGGVGKSRVAMQVATRLRDAGAVDGAWWVPLAQVTDPAALDGEILAALGLHAETGGATVPLPPAARLRAALTGKRALVVIDNCEHLIDAVAAVVQDLVTAVPGLRILCTSREVFGIPGETVWSVRSLAVPHPHAGTDLTALREHEAVRLFAERAAAAQRDFRLTEDNAGAVVEICRRLDGIPLALELAAAKVRVMGVTDLARQLDDRFALLTAGRTVHPRQRTLRAVVEWSWDLLDDRERLVYRRLGVFPSEWTLDVAARVCGRDPLTAGEVIDAHGRLVDKSLVDLRTAAPGGRYHLLETLRAFAWEQLTAAGEAAALQRRHAEQVAAVVADVAPRLRTSDQREAMDHLLAEYPNVRAALRWCADHDAAAGARIAGTLGWFWYLSRHRRDGRHWLGTFADASTGADAALCRLWSCYLGAEDHGVDTARAEVTDAAAVVRTQGSDGQRALAELFCALFAQLAGDDAEAARRLRDAGSAARAAQDPVLRATADFLAARGALVRGRWRQGARQLEDALAGFAAAGDRWGRVQCLNGLYSIAEASGDLERANGLLDQAAALADELSLSELAAVTMVRRGNLAMLRGALPRAWATLREGRRMAADAGAAMVVAMADNGLGMVARRRGDLAAARRLHTAALAAGETVGDPAAQALAVGCLGLVAGDAGDLDGAASLHRRGLGLASAARDPRAVAFALEGLATVSASASARAGDGDPRASAEAQTAAELLAAAAALRGGTGVPLAPPERGDVDRAERQVRAVLGDRALAAAYDTDAARAWETVAAMVTGPDPDPA
ncbi:MAG TPA: BTAD domain-containing putative transcriptional regulator [Euzebyales bacterium]|nr:BTAD domain-containing putative transcriptional regulator [Euzebyales bacterium]